MTQNICLFEKLTQSNHPSEAQQEIALEGETSSGMHQDEGWWTMKKCLQKR